MRLSLIIILCFGIITFTQRVDSDLLGVVVLFRHGDKTPTTSYPDDPYNTKEYWPMGFGQLTNNGKLRHYNLGLWLRDRYDDLLTSVYSPFTIHVNATDVDRTLMSAAANLAGLFPPEGDRIWNEDLAWQPIPIHTTPKSLDQTLALAKDCTNYDTLYDAALISDFYTNLTVEYADLFELVSNATGWTVDDVHYFAQLQSAFYVYENYNTSYLPSWAADIDDTDLQYLASLHYARYTYTHEMKRLHIGPFLDKIFTHFDNIVNNVTDYPKFLMLSGHEETVSAALNGMGVYDYTVPNYASTVIWELWNISGDNYMELYYRRSNETDDFLTLNVTGCDDSLCLYDDFKSILANVTVDMATWEAECIV